MRLFIIFFLLISGTSFGQDSLLNKLIPRHALKFSPYHMIGFYPTLQLAYEAKVAHRFTVQLEGGYVLDYPFNHDQSYQNKRGGKGKLELHYYMLASRRARLIYYGALELYYNAVDFSRLNTQVECYDIECNHTYRRTFNYTVTYREPGFGFKVGFVKYFSRFFMDINSGWGLRFIDYTDPHEPVGNDGGWGSLFPIPNEEDRVTPSPIVGIRLGYRLR